MSPFSYLVVVVEERIFSCKRLLSFQTDNSDVGYQRCPKDATKKAVV